MVIQMMATIHTRKDQMDTMSVPIKTQITRPKKLVKELMITIKRLHQLLETSLLRVHQLRVQKVERESQHQRRCQFYSH
jgi:hypothetical protein